MLRSLVPLPVRQLARTAVEAFQYAGRKYHLRRLYSQVGSRAFGAWAEFLGYKVRITDGANFYMQYKDEFLNRIYDIKPARPDPLIIDGGSNIGLSILYFKHTLPRSRILGFEPDPQVFKLLQENLERNHIDGVTLINAGLGPEEESAEFLSDLSAGGRVVPGGNGCRVQLHRLSTYLVEPVDFLKLNIEGQELPVLEEAERSGLLRNVNELVVEYHGWAGAEQRLGPILDLLDRQKFRYLVHDFDAETCSTSKPPFRWAPQSTWVCLVYGKRIASENA